MNQSTFDIYVFFFEHKICKINSNKKQNVRIFKNNYDWRLKQKWKTIGFTLKSQVEKKNQNIAKFPL